MKPEERIKVMYPNYNYQSSGMLSKSKNVTNAKGLNSFFKLCFNNRYCHHLRDECISNFKVEHIRFELLIGGVCDMGHFHITNYKAIEKPDFYDEAVELYNTWKKDFEEKYYKAIKIRTKEAVKEKEEKEKVMFERFKKKYGK